MFQIYFDSYTAKIMNDFNHINSQWSSLKSAANMIYLLYY